MFCCCGSPLSGGSHDYTINKQLNIKVVTFAAVLVDHSACLLLGRTGGSIVFRAVVIAAADIDDVTTAAVLHRVARCYDGGGDGLVLVDNIVGSGGGGWQPEAVTSAANGYVCAYSHTHTRFPSKTRPKKRKSKINITQ